MKDHLTQIDQGDRKDKPSAASFKVGAIALAFLLIGYQAALVIGRSARLRIEANRDRPDTVYVYLDDAVRELASPDVLLRRTPPTADGSGPLPLTEPRVATVRRGDSRSGVKRAGRSADADLASLKSNHTTASQSTLSRGRGAVTARRNAEHSAAVEAVRRASRRVETFRFNPNTVSVEDLIRLGFSEKQAQAIDNYRVAGGRFRRREDFAKSFVVADSVYRRLAAFIEIPRVDLNRADSAALDDLPGIGPWYAARIIAYRDELGGYSFPEQLLDIYRFDQEKYDALSDLVYCSPPVPYALWALPADSLALHPYIRSRQAARSIVLFRDNTPREGWTVEALGAAGILPPADAARLARCILAPP